MNAARISLLRRVAVVVEIKIVVFIAVSGIEQLGLHVEIAVELISCDNTRLSASNESGFVVENVFGVSHRRPVDTRFSAHAPLCPNRGNDQPQQQQSEDTFATKVQGNIGVWYFHGTVSS